MNLSDPAGKTPPPQASPVTSMPSTPVMEIAPLRTSVRTTLRPGQKGTRELLKSYGDQLICVRYRYDKARGKRYKTVELIVDEQEWMPSK
jgi:hypothetical protein